MQVKIRCWSSIKPLGTLIIPDVTYMSGDKLYIPVENIQIEVKISCVGNVVCVVIPHLEMIDKISKSSLFRPDDSNG